MQKPSKKPNRPYFSCGPTCKPPGWNVEWLKGMPQGRSHRAAISKDKMMEIITKHREILKIPDNYYVGIVPASDTGAFEMAMWSMLGPRAVDVVAFENFGFVWTTDIINELKLDKANDIRAEYGSLPNLSQVNARENDVVFTWNGTAGGVVVPFAEWIPTDRKGITLCDATSAVFAYDMPWDKLDVTTWSWQKCLGSEAAHGMLVLSPHAVKRLEEHPNLRPLPKLFRILKNGKLNESIFEASTINTPSMLAVEDCLGALNWVEKAGGLKAMQTRVHNNYDALAEFVESSDWAGWLCRDPSVRSHTSVCVSIVDPWFVKLDKDEQTKFIKSVTSLLATEEAAYDCAGYRAAPPSLRFWCGPTIEAQDIKDMTPWLDWSYHTVKEELS